MLTAAYHVPFSIVIPSRRRADLLQLCLESISQHAPETTEIIVVDDGSANAEIALTALRFPRVRTIRLGRSGGFCVAANRGIMAARGEIIELLNDDTQVARGWAEPALACFNDPQIGAVAPLVLQGSPDPASFRGAKGDMIDSAGDGYDRGGFAWKNGHRQRLTADYLRAGPVAGASASSVFLRRSALEQCGLFSERFGAYFEDVDLSLRLQAAGYRVYYEPASRVWHRGGSSYGQPQRRLVERQSCNEERLFWRHLDRASPWTALARHLAVLGGKAVRRCREGTFLPFALGRLRAFSEIPLHASQKEDCTCPKLPPLGRS